MKLRKLLLTALCLAGATACFAGFTACQTEPEHEHSYSQAWSYDKGNLDLGHWHECEGEDCNQVSGVGAHTWDNGTATKTVTCTEDGEITYKCTVCEVTKTETVQKLSHSYATEWTKGETGHWYACTNTGCTSKKDEAAHTYGEWVNDGRTCSVCGYTETREHTHNYSTEWSKDGTGHWYACTATGCTAKKDEAAHTYGEWVNDSRSCSVCGYTEVREHTHSYATEWSKDETGHWHACTVTGCAGKDEVVPHTYTWAYKDGASHTGTCSVTGCGYETEAEHDYKVTSQNSYQVHTCKDCEDKLAEYEISLITKKSGSSYTAYTGSAVKVILYSIVEGEYVKKYEKTVDTATGIATLLVKNGTYQVAIDDPAGYLHNDAPYIVVNPEDVYADSNLQLVVGAPAEYTLKLYYGAGEENPVENAYITVRPNSSINHSAQAYAVGKTNEDGEFKFNLSSDFGARFTQGARVIVSGTDTDNYLEVNDFGITEKTATTIAVHIQPKQLAYTVKVKAGEEFINGVTVTFKYYSKEVKSVTMEEDSDTADMGTLDNEEYTVEISGLPAEIEANYKMPNNNKTDGYNGETIIELVKKSPTYVGTVSGTNLTEISGIKVLLKDDDGNVVGEGTTDDEGKVYIECPDPQYNYTVCIDGTTMPEGYVYYNSASVGTYTNSSTNTKSSTMTLLQVIEKVITFKLGTEVCPDVIVKLYQNDILAFEGTTDNEGKVTVKAGKTSGYSLVLENLPANTICTTTTLGLSNSIAQSITLYGTANYKLTFVDEEGNAVTGATVQLGTIAYNTRNYYYTFTKSTEGTTDENGVAEIAYLIGTYYLEITGANGENYYTGVTVTGETAGEDVEKTITLHNADNAVPYSSTKIYMLGGDSTASKPYSSFVDKTTVLNISNKREEMFTYGGLIAGTYIITLENPYDLPAEITNICRYDDSIIDYVPIDDSCNFVTVNEDSSGKIISLTYIYDGTVASGMRFSITSSSTDISKIALKVEAVKANYKLTFVDENGSAVVGASVRLGKVSHNLNWDNKYSFSEVAGGTTGADGKLNISAALGSLNIEATGANGELYYAADSVTGETAGQEVIKTITLYRADGIVQTGGQNGDAIQIGGSTNQTGSTAYPSLVGRTTAVYASTHKQWLQFNCFNTLKSGKYKITLLNPADCATVEYRAGGSTATTEDNDYLTFEKDAGGNIISVTVNFTESETASRLTVFLRPTSETVSMVFLKVEAVTE